MPYAPDRIIHDADSHIMELPDWLPGYADPSVRDRFPPLELGAAGAFADKAVERAQMRAGDPSAAAALEERLLEAKGWDALGAFDPGERSRALDLLGFDTQLVFATFAIAQFIGDESLHVEGTRALNRAMVDFCADDDRLVAVAHMLWFDPETTLTTLVEALDAGCGAVLFPSHPGRGLSPTHPDFDPVWSELEERSVPFLLHIGGGGRPVKKAFHDNGREVTDFLGGGENIRSKDYMALSQIPEQFLSAMVLDGVLAAHPGLFGASIEQGAAWVPGWLRKLDFVVRSFGRTEPTIADLEMKPSEYAKRQLFATPFVGEDVGWLIEQCGEEMMLFSSDFPHPEGSRDPIGRFESTMADVSSPARDRFYQHNFETLMSMA